MSIRSVFSGREVSELAEDAERIAYAQTDLIDSRNMRVRFKTHITTGQPVFEVLDPIADLSPVASSIARDQRLFDILHDIYGEPAKLFKDKLIYKPPGADGATLHQDWIGWPGFPESFLTVLLAINARSDGGDQYEKHYREFHEWIRIKTPAATREQLFFR